MFHHCMYSTFRVKPSIPNKPHLCPSRRRILFVGSRPLVIRRCRRQRTRTELCRELSKVERPPISPLKRPSSPKRFINKFWVIKWKRKKHFRDNLLFVPVGNRPNMKMNVEGVRSLTTDSCEVIFHIEEKTSATGQTRKIPASECDAFLRQGQPATACKALGFESVSPGVNFTKDQLKDYLEATNPPQVWDALDDIESFLLILLTLFKGHRS